MIKSRRIDAICCAILAVVLIVTCLFINGDALGITASAREMGMRANCLIRQRSIRWYRDR